MNQNNQSQDPQIVQSFPPSYPQGWYPPVYSSLEEEVNLLDYWKVLKKFRGKIVLITLLFTVLGILSCILISKKYEANATIMPLTQSGGGGGLAALMSHASSVPGLGGALSGLAGGAGGQKSAQLVNFLKSRTLTEKVIQQMNLMPILFKNRWDPQAQAFRPNRWGEVPTMEDAVKVMQKKIMKVSDDKKTGLIKIQVTMKDPVMAAAVANRMLLDLQNFIEKNELTVAKRNRVFIEEQLRQNKIELLESGKKLNQFYNSNKISSIQPQLDVEIGKMLDTPKTLEDIRVSLSQVQQQKEDLDQKIETDEKSGTVTSVPSQVYLQYLTLQRELLGRVNALLTQQYEMAKIEESKEELSFQVIDKAVVPVKHVSPVPMLNIPIAFMAGLFFSIFYVFFLEYIEKMKKADLNKK